MGQGYNSCINLNNWNHLFNPNSQSAAEGALNCFDHWNRVTPSGPTITEFADSGRQMNLSTNAAGVAIGGWTYADTNQPVPENDRTAFPCPYNCPGDKVSGKTLRNLSAAIQPKMLQSTSVEDEARNSTIVFFAVVALVVFLIYKYR